MDDTADAPGLWYADAHDTGTDAGFRPEPNLSPRFATNGPAPSWLVASIAVTVALLLGVSLAVRPATAVAHGAVGDAADAGGVQAVARHDLFQLPEWHDETAGAGEPATVVADAR